MIKWGCIVPTRADRLLAKAFDGSFYVGVIGSLQT
jgi:hypothetical protein